ncbi:MAG TPA: hypothetical protein VF700_08105 [Segetibacter sp.]
MSKSTEIEDIIQYLHNAYANNSIKLIKAEKIRVFRSNGHRTL